MRVNNGETEVTLGSIVIVIFIMGILMLLAILAHEYLGVGPAVEPSIKSCCGCCKELQLPAKEKAPQLPEPMIVEPVMEEELGPEALIGELPPMPKKPKPKRK